ncbi:MAG TPA: ornithine carbamoyltransferase [Candidatus Acidoferrales bacterium]|nr:ornithine carbamoyltransferase [Candidatus Acidoferrales bacterium]
MKKDFLSIADWSSQELKKLLELAAKMKSRPEKYKDSIRGKSIALIFEKQSLRTHVTFDVGIHQLGGHSVYLTQSDINLGKRESVYDVSKNLERWMSAVVVRTYAHQSCVDMARYTKIPVVNALTDYEHPCQAIGDFLTIVEHLGTLKKQKFAFIGDGNNVCNSLMIMAAKMGMDFVAATPEGYEPPLEVMRVSMNAAKENRAAVEIVHDPRSALGQADVVYTDVWVSMGQEAEKEARLNTFRNYQVNKELMKLAKKSAIFMHCLPAHRGEEVTDDVIDSKQSVVWDESENRLHSQKAIIYTLLTRKQ